MKFTAPLRLALGAVVLASLPIHAYEHEKSAVRFHDYNDNVITNTRADDRLYFLLFSAEWCLWCKEFSEKTLSDVRVHTFLNEHFTSIFIDADIHNDLFRKYKGTGLPFTVFLNPDGTPFYKYAGTVYADHFLEVIQLVRQGAGEGVSLFDEAPVEHEYTPPKALSETDLQALGDKFDKGLLEHFDRQEYGVGNGKKSILPRTFAYLVAKGGGVPDNEAVGWVAKTLKRAIERIYDLVEGGFFRYAETRDWQIPHYEKMADHNAGAVLLLYQINALAPNPQLKEAADQTLRYLTTTLFEPQTGSFFSFQEADTSYYFLGGNERKNTERPQVIGKLFTDRLAMTLDFLVDVLDYTSDPLLKRKVIRSLNFLAAMALDQENLARFYSLSGKRWSSAASLLDHALLARLFTKAGLRFGDDRYAEVATRVVRQAEARYLDKAKGIFSDPLLNDGNNPEYLMEVNGLLALAMMDLEDHQGSRHTAKAESLITYFSAMGEVLDDRFWDAKEWEFTERYVPYLQAAEKFLARKRVSARN